MRRKSFIWISVLVLASIAAGGYMALRLSADSIRASALQNLKSFSAVANERYFAQMDPQSAAAAVKAESGIRVTMIGQDGSVLADSDFSPVTMENHLYRPEVQDALKMGEGWATRLSDTAGATTMYYAIQTENGGILRLSLPILSAMAAAKAETGLIMGMTAMLGILGVVAAYRISGGVSAKMDMMASLSEKYASGDFAMRMSSTETGPEGRLANSFNSMADRLSGTISGLTGQKAQLSGILSSISDGIVFVDADMHLTLMNDKAAFLTGMKGEAKYGEHILESVRSTRLEATLREAMQGRIPIECEDQLGGPPIAIVASPVIKEDGVLSGAVASIRDISGTRKVERMRSEFVANVTHELKTPLTSIRGFAESLIGEDDPATRDKYLATVVTESDRMSKLVDDIIALSTIESVGVMEGESDLAQEVRFAAEMISPIAAGKDIELTIEAEDGLTLNADGATLRRLAINLADNAVKYTESGGWVKIRAFRRNSDAVLEVSDNGIGISKEDQARVFERFYRVDTSRSRRLGGTGLGLSIVKHIAISMGGRAAVESAPGVGSTFSVILPLKRGKS